METLEQAIEPWHDFYTAVSAATATLVGLLFVSLSLNLKLVTGEQHAEIRALAIQTFANFTYVLILSLIFLIPNLSPSDVGITFLIFGALGTISVGHAILDTVRQRKRAWRTTIQYARFLTGRFVLPLLAYLSLIVIAILHWTGDTDSLSWMLFVIFTLLGSAISVSWDLFLELGRGSVDETAG
ncbi:MAG TPA: hypothetical protein VFS96_00850 [Nitrolancea sp.]|nr:hypothetical protein [Nitrolancea sp.]